MADSIQRVFVCRIDSFEIENCVDSSAIRIYCQLSVLFNILINFCMLYKLCPTLLILDFYLLFYDLHTYIRL